MLEREILRGRRGNRGRNNDTPKRDKRGWKKRREESGQKGVDWTKRASGRKEIMLEGEKIISGERNSPMLEFMVVRGREK